MIRNALFGISMLALSGSAFAATPVAKTHASKARVVAQAPAGDSAAPAADKPAKKEKKHTKKAKGDKTEGAKEMKGGEKTPAPAPETK